MDPRPSIAFDRVADEYDETRGGAERGRLTAKDLAPWLAPGSVLDVGVGTGVVATGLRDLGREVMGVDLATGMLSRARQRLGPRVALADARALPDPDRPRTDTSRFRLAVFARP